MAFMNHLHYVQAVSIRPVCSMLTLMLLTTSHTVIAQSSSHKALLEEVMVTAQKREQNSLDVPITVNTFSAEDLRVSGARSAVDIHHYIPGFEVTEDELTQSQISIRGIRGSNISTGGDPSVATFYDGSYVPRAATTISFSDIQRIEVLKGPQGTLFGRNAAAGVLNIIPNGPEAANSGFISVKLGNLNLRRVEAMGNLVLADNVYLRVNALSNQRDGILKNSGTGGEPRAQDNAAARVALLWTLSEKTDIEFNYDWDKIDQAAPQGIGIGPFAVSPDPFFGRVENDVVNGGEARDMYAYGLKLKHDIDELWSLRYLASYRKFETRNRLDDDGTADVSRYVDSDNIEDSDILYTELQLNYNSDRLSLVAGLNYSQEDIRQVIPVNLTTDSLMSFQEGPVILNLGGARLWDPDFWAAFSSEFTGGVPLDQSQASYSFVNDILRTAIDPNIPPHFFAPSTSGTLYLETMFNTGDFKNYGVYADADYAVSEKFSIAFGLRYSNDRKRFSWFAPLSDYAQQNPELGLYNLFIDQADLTIASKTWSKVTGRVLANYQLFDSAIGFVSYSTGYKSGGYDSLEIATAELPISPEDITNIEVGIKGDFIDGRLRAQVSAYDMSVEGSQRTILGQRPKDSGVTYYIINGNTDNKGVELTLDWLVADTLKLGVSSYYARNSSQFDEYYNALAQLVEAQTVKQNFSLSDNYTLQFDWYPEITLGSLVLHADYIFTADRLKGTPDYLSDFSYISAYGADRKRLNMNLTWLDDSAKFEVSLWGRNLTDHKLVTNIGGLGLNTIFTPIAKIEDPRTYGLDFKYSF